MPLKRQTATGPPAGPPRSSQLPGGLAETNVVARTPRSGSDSAMIDTRSVLSVLLRQATAAGWPRKGPPPRDWNARNDDDEDSELELYQMALSVPRAKTRREVPRAAAARICGQRVSRQTLRWVELELGALSGSEGDEGGFWDDGEEEEEEELELEGCDHVISEMVFRRRLRYCTYRVPTTAPTTTATIINRAPTAANSQRFRCHQGWSRGDASAGEASASGGLLDRSTSGAFSSLTCGSGASA